jgi:integrase/recombinase XerD
MTFQQYLEQYYTVQTITSYCYVINKLKERYPECDNAKYKDILRYTATYKVRGYRDLAALKKYYDYLIDIDVREDHPCKQLVIKHPSKGVQFQDLFTIQELELLLKRENRYSLLEFRNKSIISLLIYQGLTPANIANLRLKDIDLEDGTIYIKQTPKIRKRVLFIKDKQFNYLQKYLKKERKAIINNDEEALFITSKGKALTVDTLNKMLRALKPLFPDKNLNAKSIRQSVISNWINRERFSIEDVQTMSGQKWLSSTVKYKRTDLEKEIEKINKFFPDL